MSLRGTQKARGRARRLKEPSYTPWQPTHRHHLTLFKSPGGGWVLAPSHCTVWEFGLFIQHPVTSPSAWQAANKATLVGKPGRAKSGRPPHREVLWLESFLFVSS